MATLLCIIMLRRPSTPGLFRDKSIVLPVARKFGYKQLSRATKHFSKDNLLGAGSFGEVYQGELRDDPCMRLVAVKKLKQHAEQFRKDYVSEIEILGQLNHRNLVKLVGWCDGGADKQLLVYELVNNGSVDEHLHGPGRPPLGWPERYKIALGVGRAIEYLHTGCHNNLAVLHRDIKPSNVLLDEGFEAQLGDFGLVRRVNPGQSSLGGTRMIGTLAYIDPMCATTSTVSTASDMYSFGVMLLEIATGKKLVETSDARDLIEDVQKCYHNDTVLDMPDKRLSLDDLDERRQVERILAVGLLCAQHERQFRPEITIVVKLLSDLSHPLPAPGVRNDSSAELQI
ncbi:hypothetical protein HU200_064672 [Digitaria exilis]|uniref:Protein kinase domain-containing protein n=1 Tax=Digitaria exilis TaxID=1010633 RepID=A0A835A3V1_9POAL|nr:hypothetical protein HU200_064672 [Digitaria exilis]